MTIRQDKFKIGDRVTMIPGDDYTDDSIIRGFQAKNGAGPYTIEEVEEGQRNFWGMGHTQFITVCGECFSGYWFNPTTACPPTERT